MPGGPRGLQNRCRFRIPGTGGRFDSYPLRLNFSRLPERIPQAREESKDPVAVSQGNSPGFLDFARNDEHQKEVTEHVA